MSLVQIVACDLLPRVALILSRSSTWSWVWVPAAVSSSLSPFWNFAWSRVRVFLSDLKSCSLSLVFVVRVAAARPAMFNLSSLGWFYFVSLLTLGSRLPIFDSLAPGADLSQLASPPFLLVELFSFLPPVFLVPFCQGGEHAPECRQGSLSCCFHLRLSGAHCPQPVRLCTGSSCRFSSRSKSVGSACSQCGHVFLFSLMCGLLQELISVLFLSYRIKKLKVF
jgi:hypothetical protein